MKRRDFAKIVGSAAIALGFQTSLADAEPNDGIIKKIKPKALEAGDKIGIIAPATNVSDPDDFRKAMEVMDYFGLKPVLGKSLKNGSGYKTRAEAERLQDIHEFFANDEIKGIFCIRGGYGAVHLLNKIDYALIKNNPKVFLGYSDITSLHLAINKLTGLVTFHGPVLLSEFSSFTEEYFKKAVFGTKPIGIIENPKDKINFRAQFPVRTIKPGIAQGELIGGNLTLVCSLMGTPYEINTKGKILFLEDDGEEPYRIDRMMNQLKLAGKFADAAGIVIGECSNCTPKKFEASRVFDFSLGELLDNVFSDLDKPVFYGLLFGHTSRQATLPIGVRAEIDANKCILNILDSATT